MIDPFDISEAPVGEPFSLVVGQSAQWRRIIAIDPSIHTLTYVLRRKVPVVGETLSQNIDVTNSAGSEWGVDVLEADTAGWASGDFFWDLTVTRTSDSRTRVIATGEFKVFGTEDDRRSHASIMVKKIESILERRADDDVESYSIKSRSITKMNVGELRGWRDYYVRELRNEVLDTGMFATPAASKSTLRVRFRD